eukprot:CAMPEP_0170184478 /NCGR_PEP_ID=MMETSP0040_2-20121228/33749_1 /TAXON_ID=641309 /ORGANISM="Lotharella oceanica, Strain CCMP622" /LENGTH=111 /DNA_ID=CAMNT_0010430559 /DNA_START=125 /DNA_END=457 /DNA_ORIENTATION=+
MVFAIEQGYGDIKGKAVADLGCGCGMLTIATHEAGASYNIGFDVDADALRVCKENLREHDVTADLIQTDIRCLLLSLSSSNNTNDNDNNNNTTTPSQPSQQPQQQPNPGNA